MNQEQIFEQVRQVMARTFGVNEEVIVSATRAEEIERWDSLTHLIVLTGIERRMNVKLPTDEAYAAQNVGELVALVKRTLDKQGARG
jgi:acyl carrier protein